MSQVLTIHVITKEYGASSSRTCESPRVSLHCYLGAHLNMMGEKGPLLAIEAVVCIWCEKHCVLSSACISYSVCELPMCNFSLALAGAGQSLQGFEVS